MILILAGNKDEFDEFLEKHTPKNIFRYIRDEADYMQHKNAIWFLSGLIGIIHYGKK